MSAMGVKIDAQIAALCGEEAINDRGDAWRLLRDRLGDDDEAQAALSYLLGDLGSALAFVSIEGARYAELLESSEAA